MASVTVAPGSEKPFSRNTAPATTAWGASFFRCAHAAPNTRSAHPHNAAASLLPGLVLIVVVFVFFVSVLVVFVQVVVKVFFIVLVDAIRH